jgi:putative ABC transport system permease protein
MAVRTLIRRHRRVVAFVWLTLGLGGAASIAVASLVRFRTVWPLSITPLVRARSIPDTTWVSAWTDSAITPAATQNAGISALLATLAALAAAASLMAIISVLVLLAARRIERRRDVAVRAAVGASPRMLHAESRNELGFLFGGGLFVAILCGLAAAARLRTDWPDGLLPPPVPDLTAIIVTLLIVGGPLALLALAPGAAGVNLQRLLAAGSATSARREGLHHSFAVIIEIALALTLACTTMLLLRHGETTTQERPDVDGVVALEMHSPVRDGQERARVLATLLERVASLEQIRAESLASPGTWLGMGTRDRVLAECGLCIRANMLMPVVPAMVVHHAVSPGFFQALSIPIVDGRDFGRDDAFDADHVAIVNETFAAASFQDARPIGHRVQIGGLHGEWFTVIGVVRDRPARGIGAPRVAMPALYVSTRQEPPLTLGLALTTDLEPDVAARLVESVTRDLGGTAITEATTLHEQFQRATLPLDWFGRLFAVIAASALLLALHGVHSAVRQLVLSRRREFAIRTATGAAPLRILAIIVRKTSRLAVAGIILGAIGAWTAGRAIQMKIGGVPTFDLGTTALLAAALAFVALAAAVPPALRVALNPPLDTLRQS